MFSPIWVRVRKFLPYYFRHTLVIFEKKKKRRGIKCSASWPLSARGRECKHIPRKRKRCVNLDAGRHLQGLRVNWRCVVKWTCSDFVPAPSPLLFLTLGCVYIPYVEVTFVWDSVRRWRRWRGWLPAPISCSFCLSFPLVEPSPGPPQSRL